MRKPTVIAFVVMLTVAVFSAIAFAAPTDRWGGRLACHQAEGLNLNSIRGCATTAGETPAPPKTAVSNLAPNDDGPLPGVTRFATITVTIDPKGVALAAYQFEITAGHSFTVVGLDNAGHPAFSGPPHYDRSAAAGGTDRLIVADYSTRPADELDAKPQATATIHAAFRVDAGTDTDALTESVAVTLTAAADAAGNRIDADITYELHLAERPGSE